MKGFWNKIRECKCLRKCHDVIKPYSGLIYLFLLMTLFTNQVWQYFELKSAVISFMNVGQRFTYQDGHELCARMQELERLVGVEVQECFFKSDQMKQK
jgi:hypothetical protein